MQNNLILFEKIFLPTCFNFRFFFPDELLQRLFLEKFDLISLFPEDCVYSWSQDDVRSSATTRLLESSEYLDSFKLHN